MTSFRNSYPVISSLEEFRELLEQRGRILIQKVEPDYFKRFQICEGLGLESRQTLKECNPLLSSKLIKFINLMESLYEVRYYWKRMSETARLLEVSVPTMSPQIDESSWFIYNLDFYWHAVYGLHERIIKFLTNFKRMYKTPSNEERDLVDTHGQARGTLTIQASLDALRASFHSPTGNPVELCPAGY